MSPKVRANTLFLSETQDCESTNESKIICVVLAAQLTPITWMHVLHFRLNKDMFLKGKVKNL